MRGEKCYRSHLFLREPGKQPLNTFIPVSKWLGSPPFISHEFRPFGRGITRSLGDLRNNPWFWKDRSFVRIFEVFGNSQRIRLVPFPPRFGSPIGEVRCVFFVVTASMSMNGTPYASCMVYLPIFYHNKYNKATIHVGKFTIHHGISCSFKRYEPYFEGLELRTFVFHGHLGSKGIFSESHMSENVITWSKSRWCFNGVREWNFWCGKITYIDGSLVATQTCYMFTPIWGRFPIWLILILFKGVETTN